MTPTSPAPPGLPARLAALRLLDAVLRRGLPLDGALDSAARGLPPEDRALAHAITAATLRHLHDLDALVDARTRQPLPADGKARAVLRLALAQCLVLRTPPHAAIATALPLVDGGPRRLVHGVLGAVLRGDPALPMPPTLPPAVAARWAAQWGDAAVAAASVAAAQPAPLDLTLRDAGETARWAEQLDATVLAPGRLRLPAGTRVGELPGYAEGAWWVQDIAASLPAALLGAGHGRRALDLCAAPGGKTMQLAAQGWATEAVDLQPERLERLRANLLRTRLPARVRQGDALTLQAEPADAVLLDAPCSATGTFRRHPDVLHRVRPPAIARLGEQGAAMLARAAGLVRPGGQLLFATCSLEAAEGEAVADAFLRSHAGFTTEPVLPAELPAGFAPDAAGRVRVLPGTLAAAGGADGFFIARFRRG